MTNRRFIVSTKIAKSTDPASSRYALGNLHACAAKDGGVFLTATDGHQAAIVRDVDGQIDNPCLVPADVATQTGRRPLRVECNGHWTNDKGKFAACVNEGRFPRVPDAVPDLESFDGVRLAINAGLLKKLADSISDDGIVHLFIPPEGKDGGVNRAIAVEASRGFGVIMPLDGGDWESHRRSYTAQADAYRDSFSPVEHG